MEVHSLSLITTSKNHQFSSQSIPIRANTDFPSNGTIYCLPGSATKLLTRRAIIKQFSGFSPLRLASFPPRSIFVNLYLLPSAKTKVNANLQTTQQENFPFDSFELSATEKTKQLRERDRWDGNEIQPQTESLQWGALKISHRNTVSDDAPSPPR